MANNNLIAGAALVGQSKRTNWAESFQQGLNESLKVAAFQNAQKKAAKNAINQKTENYINSLNSNVDLSNLTPDQQNAITNYLVKKRGEYAAAASQLARIEDVSSPEYMQLRDQMNGVQMAFGNLANELKSYKQDKVDYLKDFDNKLLSEGNDLDALDEASNMYTDKGLLGVSEGGGLVFWNDKKGSYDSYNQIKKPFLKDFKTADAILNLNSQLYNAGASLTGARRNMIRQKLNNLVSQGGRQTLLSLASDDFIVEGGLGLQDPALFEKGNEDALKQAVLDGYMSALEDTARQGANDKHPAQSSRGGSASGLSKAMQEEVNTTKSIAENALAFSSIVDDKYSPGQTEEKAASIVQELNAIDPTKYGNYITRGEYYSGWLEMNDLDDSQEARNKFINKHPRNQQIFLYSPSRGDAQPLNVDINNKKDLYELYLYNSNLSNKAKNFHVSNYDNYVGQTNTQENTSPAEKTTTIDTSKYN